ncbi:1-acyl-sn-glycerol-3-phosphate acyltransferase [Marinimicrobium sp. ABcell2]|uniref:lysophospholipid acyltransferase family protein n=1 Tax=Marinimicrobium sp. ABcell2 TaxID=3069751 RepID=UPI0027B144E9|nr:lysophospholipid acyltransferase family protein [Marinimicrobium sp. ABcell2]MDQ2076978.1 lysophospholipid acyltransferase family protein [Marinimicrobium sp. ABcell2]
MSYLRYSADRIWRILATGFCFAFFFVGGFLQTLLLFPLLRALPGDEATKTGRVRTLQKRNFRFFVAMMETLGLIRVRLHNLELLQRSGGCIVIANHPTLIDVVILLAYLPSANCVVKGELWRSRFIGGVMRGAGFISNENGSELLAGCRQALDHDEAILIFPEGSRTVPGEGLAFKRGMAQVAVRTGAPVLTVFITCDPITLIKGEPWYRIPPRRAEINVHVGEILQPVELIEAYDDKPAAARQLTRYLQNYFEQGLKLYG